MYVSASTWGERLRALYRSVKNRQVYTSYVSVKQLDSTYSGEREVHTFAELHHAARVLIETSQLHRRGNFYTAMSAFLLEAFTFEAYLNHLGEKHLKLWKDDERIRWKDKFKRVRRKIGLKTDGSKRPYLTLRKLFAFRNALAHGRSEIVTEEFEVDSAAPLNYWPRTEWEKYCTRENLLMVREDVSVIIGRMHKAAGLGPYPFDTPGAKITLKL
jgi:hypothetical protein